MVEKAKDDYLPSPSELVKRQAALSAVSSNFNLMKTPDGTAEIGIIEGLGAKKYAKELYLQLKGYTYNFLTEKWEKGADTNPVMNEEGIRNIMAVINMALRMDFSNIEEDDIPRLTLEFYKSNFPQFSIYYEEWGLDLKNINIIHTACWLPFYIAARNAKGSGHRNAVRGTLSEQVLAKMAAGDNEKKGFFEKVKSMFRGR